MKHLEDITLSQFVWVLCACTSLGLIAGAIPYGWFDPALINHRRVTTTESHPLVFIHVFSGTIWLISGLMQFTKTFLEKRFYHVLNGYTYLICCLICSGTLILINLKLQERSTFSTSPLVGAIYSIICSLVGWIYISKKEIQLHRAWMIRSFLPAVMMPIDRFLTGISLAFKISILDPLVLGFLLLMVTELIIFRKLNHKLMPLQAGSFMKKFFFAFIVLFFFISFFLTFWFEHTLIYSKPFYPQT